MGLKWKLQITKWRSHFRVFGHFFHLHFSFWDGNRDSVGAGKSCVPGCYRVNNLTEKRRKMAAWETKKKTELHFTKRANAKQWRDQAKENNVRLEVCSFLDDNLRQDLTEE